VEKAASEEWQRRLETATRDGSLRAQTIDLEIAVLTILHHPDSSRVGERLTLPELAPGEVVALSRVEPGFAAPGETRKRPLAEPHLSRRPLHLIASGKRVGLRCHQTSTSVLANGEAVNGGRDFSPGEVSRGVVLVLGNRVVLLLHSARSVNDRKVPSFGLVGESDALVQLRHEIQRVAEVEIPVLLRGATGTGKELVARAIHDAGPRRNQPYVAINMGAIPPSLAAAELFGIAKGAFTGAEKKRPGFFRQADRGTLFLDEIGEVPQEVQPLLLRALECGEIQPVGADRPLRVQVRTLAATDSNLEADIKADRFRSPLLHRLSGYVIHLPPLRNRREDIGRLLVHFLRQELAPFGQESRLDDPGVDGRPWLPAPLVARLAAASWPGNVRQLRNVARQLTLLGRKHSEILIDSRVEGLLESCGEETRSRRLEPSERPSRSPREIADEELVAALATNRWHPGSTARQLGISRASLYVLIDQCPRTRKAADLSRQEVEQARIACGGRIEEMVERLQVSTGGIKRRMRLLGIRGAVPTVEG
jgi:two-component system nitrogen regulation response regulator GlnG